VEDLKLSSSINKMAKGPASVGAVSVITWFMGEFNLVQVT